MSRKPLFRFIVVSDMHYGVDAQGEQGDFRSRMQLVVDSLIYERDNAGLDFYIANGDVIHHYSDDGSTVEALMETALENYLNVVGVPYYVTLGNHDRLDDETWEAIVGKPKNQTFIHDGFGFVLMNSSDTEGARQVCVDEDFLDDALTRLEHSRGVFYISHIPRYKGGFIKSPTGDSPNCSRIIQSLTSFSKLILMAHGHFHYEDGRHDFAGIPVFFNSHVSTYGTPYWGLRVFEVYDDHVHTYQKNMQTGHIVNSDTVPF